MHLSSILVILPIIFSSILAQQIPNCPAKTYRCDSDWRTRTDDNTGEADAFCRARCAEVVSIHSQEEQDFVTRIAGPILNRCQFTSACRSRAPNPQFDRLLRSFWIGLNRATGTLKTSNSVDNDVYCLWSDRTGCADFGTFPNNSVNANTNSPPWTRGNPNGVNTADSQILEDCTQMVESRRGGWNDIPCYYRIGGVICKRQCNSYCAAQDVNVN
uniref:C-type lectin domain-containing protein n=1 Tax=Meloidogyne hapla TaxID=6305 RepID=A0A1I8BPP5_MELHA